MNYSQSANPNATNSELDAKVIIKNYQLNSSQKDKLIEQFVELQVDNMDTQTLVEFVTDILIDDYSKLTDSEVKERVNLFQDDEQLYNELVENVLISELCEEVK
tara:strand:- start:2020 stop:2331 length:312 start_codon:yes stop_codon:yes gene_type:complete